MASGNVPNLLWNAITFEELRQLPGFDGLPPVDDVALTSTDSYRQADLSSHFPSRFCLSLYHLSMCASA